MNPRMIDALFYRDAHICLISDKSIDKDHQFAYRTMNTLSEISVMPVFRLMISLNFVFFISSMASWGNACSYQNLSPLRTLERVWRTIAPPSSPSGELGIDFYAISPMKASNKLISL